jgi:16S rRNA processing protein RimM
MSFNAEMPKRRKIEKTGSPAPGEPVFLAVGKLRRSHGLGGEILMDILTDFPERLRPRKNVFIGRDYAPYVIKGVRATDKHLLVTLDGISTPEDANQFRNQFVYVRVDQLPPLPEGEFYHHELLNMQVENENGKALGVLVEILETAANDVYVVRQEGQNDLLLPAIESVIVEVDLRGKRMVVRPPDWL